MRVRLPAASSLLALMLSLSFCIPAAMSVASAHGGTRGSDTAGTWSEFRGNLNNTGYSTASVPASNLTFLRYETGNGFYSSPAVSGDTLFFGSNDGKVRAINLTSGGESWNYSTGSAVWATPLIVGDTVFIGSMDSSMYALNQLNGTCRWYFTANDSISSSAKYVDGTVIFASYDGNVYFVNATTGRETRPPFRTNGQIWGTPAVVNGTIIVGSNDGNVSRVRISDGSVVWKFQLAMQWSGFVKYSSAAVYAGRVFIGSDDRNEYALDLENGSLIWQFRTGAAVYASPGIHAGRVFVHSVDGNLYAVPFDDPDDDKNISTSEILWTFRTGDGPEGIGGGSSPAIAGGRVLVAARQGILYCVNEITGARVWSYATAVSGLLSFSSPALVDGRVFVGLSDGAMYGFSELAPGMTVEIVPSKMVIESLKAIEVLFFVNHSGLPVEGAAVGVTVSVGTLSQNMATTLADGMQKVKYLPPRVSRSTVVTFTANVTKYGLAPAGARVSVTIVPAQDYGTESGNAFTLDKYQTFFLAIAALVAANAAIYVAILVRRRRRQSS